MIRAEFKKIHPYAILPKRAKITDACWDLFSCEHTIVNPIGVHKLGMERGGGTVDYGGSITNVRTGIRISVPQGWYMTVEGRSGLYRKGVIPTRGILDSTYNGEFIVALVNMGNEPYVIQSGDRIAQMALHQVYDIDFVEVEEFTPPYNQRGTAGFGSTGK